MKWIIGTFIVLILIVGMLGIKYIPTPMEEFVDINKPLLDNIDDCAEYYSESYCFAHLPQLWLALTESARLHYEWEPSPEHVCCSC